MCAVLKNTTYSKQYETVAVNVIVCIAFMAGISLATFGNLVVIICITHFKQLHTPTNVLTLSMAFADFLIGIFIMPVKLIQTMDKCWDFGDAFSWTVLLCYTILSSTSIAHLIFLAIDRYYAVCNPLLYSSIITTEKAWVFVAISWISSVCFSAIINYVSNAYLYNMENSSSDFCLFVINLILIIVDMVFVFVLPFSLMLVLYCKIFIVAVQHARTLRNVANQGNAMQSDKKGHTERQNKATITIGIVTGTFFIFISQFYILYFLVTFMDISVFILDITEYLILFNFALNPLIYGLYYPWFRKGFKCIITCRIFKPDSSLTNLLS